MARKLIRTQADFTDFSDAALWREELSSIISPEDWHEVGTSGEPAFENSWVNFDSTVYETAAFYKTMNRVYLKGFIKSGTVGTFAVFTLPEGYRPSLLLNFPTITNTGVGRIDITANGAVRVLSGGNSWATLDGISFRI